MVNSLASYFLRGMHTVGVDGRLAGSHGIGQFQLGNVTLDKIEVRKYDQVPD